MRLTKKRRYAKVGDIFRLSPKSGIVLWGRVIKAAKFFGHDFEMKLVYIYDAVSEDLPAPELLTPANLIINPQVVNNLGWVRGYWEIMRSQPVSANDMRDRHLFVNFRGEVVDEDGKIVADAAVNPNSLGPAAYSNFNYIDDLVTEILEERGAIQG